MLIMMALVALLGLSSILWWKLSIAQNENVQLQAEVLRLRGRLRGLRA